MGESIGTYGNLRMVFLPHDHKQEICTGEYNFNTTYKFIVKVA